MNWQTVINSDALWLVLGFVLNTVATVFVARIPADGPVRKFIRAIHGLLDKIDPPSVAPLLPLLFAIGIASMQSGCVNRSVVQTKVQQALVFEDKVHTQVVVLETVFKSAVMFLPADKRAEATAKLEQAELILQQTLDAKDNALQAALEASSEQVDLAALVPPIIKAIESIIAIVADVRSFAKSVEPRAVAAMPNDDVIEVQREKLRQLAGALK